MAKKKKDESPFKKNISIRNRKASFEYSFLETFTAGMVLQGTEIKSIRMGKVNLSDAFCFFIGSKLVVRGMHISSYKDGTRFNHLETADRTLLLHKNELRKIAKALDEQGTTIIPFHLFINEKGFAKLEIALARGKKLFDKRATIKEKDIQRELDRRF